MGDKRKRQWLKLDAYYPHDHRIQKLIDDLGPTAGFLWICLLTAAKRNTPQGQFTYVTDDAAIRELTGRPPDEFPYTFTEFVRNTGRRRLTRMTNRSRTRDEDATNVRVTRWEEWQKGVRTGTGRWPENTNDHKGKYTTKSKPQNHAEIMPNTRPKSLPESESESEMRRGKIMSSETVENSHEGTPPADVTHLLDNLLGRQNGTELELETDDDIEANRQRQLKHLRAMEATE